MVALFRSIIEHKTYHFTDFVFRCIGPFLHFVNFQFAFNHSHIKIRNGIESYDIKVIRRNNRITLNPVFRHICHRIPAVDMV